MDKNQFSKKLFDSYINEDVSIKKIIGLSAKVIKELFVKLDVTVKNWQDLISSIDDFDLLWPEKLALINLWNIYKEQYPSVLQKPIEKKNEKIKVEIKERELVNQKWWNVSFTEWSEQFSEWPSKKMNTMMQSQYNNMNNFNKPYI